MGKERATWEKRERHASEFVYVPGVTGKTRVWVAQKPAKLLLRVLARMHAWMDGIYV